MIMTHIRSILILSCLLLFLLSCTNEQRQPPSSATNKDWHYFGLAKPTDKPVLFSPEIVSTRRNERDFAISPAGNVMYYSLVLPEHNLSVILHLTFDGFFWSEPQVASFSGQYNDLEPAFSPDGKKIFFISKRPLEPNQIKDDYDIWYLENTEKGWSKPINAGSNINTSGEEYYPSVTNNGTIYFTAQYDDSFGGEDIYFSRFENGSWLEPQNAGAAINSEAPEFNAFISPDESFILFTSCGRDDDLGGGDIYISYKHNGQWTQAVNLGESINSDKLDFCPFVSHDGEFLFFTSHRLDPRFFTHVRKKMNTVYQMADNIKNGLGNIYWVKFNKNTWK